MPVIPLPVKVVAVAIIFGGAIAANQGPPVVSDPSCQGCASSHRMGQALMEKNNGGGKAEGSSQPNQNNSSNRSEGYSQEDIERMKKGQAPKGSDKNPKELHHPNQDPKAPVREMTRTDPRGKGNYTKNHPHGNRRPSRIDRQKFKKEREEYWKNKAKDQELK